MSFKFYSSPRKKREYPEARLQKVIASYLMMSGSFFFSIPNEGNRTPMMTAHLKAMGLHPGAADLCIIVKGRAHFLEVKSDAGKISPAQSEFQTLCAVEGVPYKIVNNISDALTILSEWGAINSGRVAA